MNIRNTEPNRAQAGGLVQQFVTRVQEWMRESICPATRSLLAQVAQGLADSREGEDATEADALNPLRVFVRPVLACMTRVRSRWRQAESSSRSFWTGVVSFVVALLLTNGVKGVLQSEAPLLFLSAVMVSAILGGLRAGLLTTSLIALPCVYLLVYAAPTSAASASGLLRIGLFTLLAFTACALSDSLYLARQQAEIARQQAESLARRSLFLARASALLDSSHDPVTLALQVTRAIVPAFAEGAVIDLLDAHQTLRRVAAMHQNPEKEALLDDLNFRFPLDTQANHPVANALRTGQAELIEQVEETLLTAISPDADYLDLARRFGTRSLVCAPLVARNRTFGTLTLISTSADRRYTPTDLVVAKDLALRMALALDNLRLYQEAQQEISERAQMEQQIRDYSRNLEQQRLQLEEANICLSLQVSRDGLTGLNNHLAFQETLAKEVQRATRYQLPLSVLLLDVDKFKQYNDTYGHPAGDQVLRKVAEVLRTGARETDFVARYGGEEFAVILPNANEAEAQEVAERLRGAIEAMRGLERLVTASFGIATLEERMSASPELISGADKALYASKHAGRNRATHARLLLLENSEDRQEGHNTAVEAVVAVHKFVSSERS